MKQKTKKSFVFFSILITLFLIMTLIPLSQKAFAADSNVAKHEHQYSKEWSVDKPATKDEDGSKSHHCTVAGCDAKTDVTEIPKIWSAEFKKDSYTYTGQEIKPELEILDDDINEIPEDDYTITKSDDCISIGKHTYTITYKNEYSGTDKLSFKITPAKAEIASLTQEPKSLEVTAKEDASAYYGSGFQIAYKILWDDKWKYKTTTEKTYKFKVAENDRYSVKIRAYSEIDGEKYYGPWSSVKKTYDKKVKVTFVADKGKFSKKSKKYMYISIFDEYFNLPVVTSKRKNYMFTGWYTEKTGGKEITDNMPVQYYRDHTLYAHWAKSKTVKHSLSFMPYKAIKKWGTGGGYTLDPKKKWVSVRLDVYEVYNGKMRYITSKYKYIVRTKKYLSSGQYKKVTMGYKGKIHKSAKLRLSLNIYKGYGVGGSGRVYHKAKTFK